MSALRAESLRHVRPVRPLHFPEQEPEDEHLGQGRRHLNLCIALYQLLRSIADLKRMTVGADQFVYFDAANPKRCLAPDAFVKLNRPDSDFDSWKVWEEGTPELAIEVLSPKDSPERWTFAEKLRRYRALGVRELVVFFVDARRGRRLRAWDRIDGDLVERVVEDERTPCLTLGMTFVIAPVDEYPMGLRLARDAAGRDLVPTLAERAAKAEKPKGRASRRR